MLVLPIVACLIASCSGAASDDAPDNRGTEFVIGFMDNGRSNVDTRLFITTATSENVQVRVTSPKFFYKNALLIDETFDITYGEVMALDLDHRIVSDRVEFDSKGILIEATDEITVYTEYRGNDENDGFLALPTNVLGTEYISVSYYPSRKETQFLIIATEDDTTVEITMPDDDLVEVKYLHDKYMANDAFNVTMDRYDSFQVQAHRGDLTGAYIKANKPVAFFSGNEETNVLPDKSYDHLVEQIPPISTWGKTFAFVSTPERTVGDVFRFVAAKDGTTISVTCSGGFSSSFVINARQHEDIDTLSDGACWAQASEGVMLVQFIKSQTDKRELTDPSMIVIYPVEQFASAYSFTTPISLDSKRVYQAYVTLVIKESEKDGLRLDGEPLPSSTFVAVPNSDLVGTYVPITEGAHILQHINPIHTFGGIIYGSASKESYGMPLGTRMDSINEACTPSASQLGDGIDNDCDGLIDEELCAPASDDVDEDGDGNMNEDCAQINGDWGQWEAWSDCSVSCSMGIKTRTRECNDLAPQGVGFYCWGADNDVAECDTDIECPSAPDSRGTEFILGFMENKKSKTDVELFITTSRVHDVNVRVTSPKHFDKRGDMTVDAEFTVTAGYIHNLELDSDIACEGTEMASKGIHVEADDEVVVYGTNLEKYSNDGFLGLPVDVLGLEYYAVVYSPSNDDNELLIVATEDDTEVQIHLPNDDDVEIKVSKDVLRDSDDNKRRKRDVYAEKDESIILKHLTKRSKASKSKDSEEKSSKKDSKSDDSKAKASKVKSVKSAKSESKSVDSKAKASKVKSVKSAKSESKSVDSKVKASKVKSVKSAKSESKSVDSKAKASKVKSVKSAKSESKSVDSKAKASKVKSVKSAKSESKSVDSKAKASKVKSVKSAKSESKSVDSKAKASKVKSVKSAKSESKSVDSKAKASKVKSVKSAKSESKSVDSKAKASKVKSVKSAKSGSKSDDNVTSAPKVKSVKSGSKSVDSKAKTSKVKSVKSAKSGSKSDDNVTSAPKIKSVKSGSKSDDSKSKASKSKSVKSGSKSDDNVKSAPKVKSVKSGSKSDDSKSKASKSKSVKSGSKSDDNVTSAPKVKSVKSGSKSDDSKSKSSKSKSVKSGSKSDDNVTSVSKIKSVKSGSKSDDSKSNASKSKSVKSGSKSDDNVTSAPKLKSVKSGSKSDDSKSNASKSKSVKSGSKSDDNVTSAPKLKSVKSGSKSDDSKSKASKSVKSGSKSDDSKSKASKSKSEKSGSKSDDNVTSAPKVKSVKSGSKSDDSKSKASKSKSEKSGSKSDDNVTSGPKVKSVKSGSKSDDSKSKSSKSKSEKSGSKSDDNVTSAPNVKVSKGDYEANDLITLSMDRFDTFQAQSKKGDLTGAYITSNKPIAVFSGNVRAYVLPKKSWDHLVEQLLPVGSWGKTFAIVPTPERTNTGDTIRFVGAVADTKITVTCSDGLDEILTVNNREYQQIDIASEAMCYAEATEGIMVALFVKSETNSREPTDPSMILIPPIGQYGAAYSFTTPKNSHKRRDYQSYVNFVVREVAKDGLLLDGMPLPADTIYNPIPQTQMVGGFVKVNEGAHTLVHESPIQVFGATLYGATKKESYGMPLGLRLADINLPCFPSTMSLGDGINNDCDEFIDEELCGNGIDDDGDGVEDEDCAPNPPVNGNWTTWSHWSDCSELCGDVNTVGEMSRTRDCTNPEPSEDGLKCVGNATEIETCSPTTPCSVDGIWGQWEEWTPCSVSCASGTRQRYRYCDDPEPYGDGDDCAGDDFENAVCDTQVVCPVHGGFSAWSTWSACPVTCGIGFKSRQRLCDNPEPQDGGRDCVGDYDESEQCDAGLCPVDGGFGPWSLWNSCSVTCGTGTKDRSRLCDNPAPQNGGDDCSGDTSETEACDEGNCPVDGGFSDWEAWSSCPVTCGTAVVTRDRVCNNPSPQHGGVDCVGDTSETKACDSGTACIGPVDGKFSVWSSWSSCSVSCGTGTKDRSRSCDNPAPLNGGADCSGDTNETVACDEGNCPIDGEFSDWSTWSSCSVTCGTGTKDRGRSCDNPAPQYGGANCSGDTSETEACDEGNCASLVDGEFSDWSTWSSCSVTCGTGTKDRSRSCDNPAPQNGGADCSGDTDETEACDEGNCPVDGGFSDWGTWSSCPVTCGTAVVTRDRVCNNPSPQHGGVDCVGDTSETQSCDSGITCIAPVDGGFTDWSTWTSCSVTCGTGTKDRSRSCDSPTPQNGGDDCSGDTSETMACDEGNCPVDGGFSDWGAWSSCPVTCGTAVVTRDRECNNPSPQHGGADCVGDTNETQSCDSGTTCAGPVDGGFSDWSIWTSCSVTCGTGTKDRSRSCDSPTPQNGGDDCSGDTSETMACDEGNCPVDGGFSDWGAWSSCPVTCGTAVVTRDRVCNNPSPQHGGADCVGDTSETQTCDSGTTCVGPVDGGFSSWSTWSACSVTCSTGVTTRSRSCNSPSPQNGGADCIGDSVETTSCDAGSCSGVIPDVDGSWGDWLPWISCTKTCGGGITMRTRECSNPEPSGNGQYCEGTAFESGPCNTANCPSPYSGIAGDYVNKCPAGFFTCKAGSIVCIQEIFRCDCAHDCDDGTDENEEWGACTAEIQELCQNSASVIGSWNGVLMVLLAGHLLAWFFRNWT